MSRGILSQKTRRRAGIFPGSCIAASRLGGPDIRAG